MGVMPCLLIVLFFGTIFQLSAGKCPFTLSLKTCFRGCLSEVPLSVQWGLCWRKKGSKCVFLRWRRVCGQLCLSEECLLFGLEKKKRKSRNNLGALEPVVQTWVRVSFGRVGVDLKNERNAELGLVSADSSANPKVGRFFPLNARICF